MSTISFIEARFLSANEGRLELETRFKKHLRKLRCRRLPPGLLAPPDDVAAACDRPDIDPMDIIGISADDAARIQRRANASSNAARPLPISNT